MTLLLPTHFNHLTGIFFFFFFFFLIASSFLLASTNLISYSITTLACWQAWQCGMNRGLSLAGRNESMYFEIGSKMVEFYSSALHSYMVPNQKRNWPLYSV